MEVGPRLSFESAVSSNAKSICRASGVDGVTRLEVNLGDTTRHGTRREINLVLTWCRHHATHHRCLGWVGCQPYPLVLGKPARVVLCRSCLWVRGLAEPQLGRCLPLYPHGTEVSVISVAATRLMSATMPPSWAFCAAAWSRNVRMLPETYVWRWYRLFCRAVVVDAPHDLLEILEQRTLATSN